MDISTPQAAETSAKNSGASMSFVRAMHETYVETHGKPSIVKASVYKTAKPDIVGVDLVTSQRDFTNDTNQATDIGSKVLSLQSPTDPSLRAVLRNGKEKSGCFVEIWCDGILTSNYDVSATHGQFYGDETFGSLAWSNDNSYL
ncbi:hypothetical protein LPJ64_005310, partial [Coemansia asiatica]